MTQRASAETIDVDASHSSAVSQPDAVVALIQSAVDATVVASLA
jgi:hypothetical protein